jgi:hypothetical protein
MKGEKLQMTTPGLTHVERLKNIYDDTIESDTKIQIDIKDIDYYSLLCHSIGENKIHKMFNCNLCSFNCEFEGEDAVVMIFSVPLSTQSENADKKHSSERVMDIIKVVEECFTIDYMNFKEVKEDKFSYITIIKKVKECE